MNGSGSPVAGQAERGRLGDFTEGPVSLEAVRTAAPRRPSEGWVDGPPPPGEARVELDHQVEAVPDASRPGRQGRLKLAVTLRAQAIATAGRAA